MVTNPYLESLYEAIEALPEGYNGELIAGRPYTQPRPTGPHALAASSLGGELYGPCQRGRCDRSSLDRRLIASIMR